MRLNFLDALFMRVTRCFAITIKNNISYYATSDLIKPFAVNKFEVKYVLDPTAKYNFVVKLEKISSPKLLIRDGLLITWDSYEYSSLIIPRKKFKYLYFEIQLDVVFALSTVY